MSNPVLHWQILSRNPEATASFYGDLFGWQVSAANQLHYREVKTGSLPGGIWPVAPGEGHPMVQLFVGVPDVAAHVAKATALGAKVIVPPQQLPDGDEMAILLDPDGLPLGIMKQR
jgi:predicted enzyme related to lactoylglutathione lyase